MTTPRALRIGHERIGPETTGRALDRAYVLRLYIAGLTARSTLAVERIRAICERHLVGRYDLTVVDLYLCPDEARAAQIVVAPTLVKQTPGADAAIHRRHDRRKANSSGLEHRLLNHFSPPKAHYMTALDINAELHEENGRLRNRLEEAEAASRPFATAWSMRSCLHNLRERLHAGRRRPSRTGCWSKRWSRESPC